MYPAIKSCDKVSFTYKGDNHNGEIGIVVRSDAQDVHKGMIQIFSDDGSNHKVGYQDNPQLMENGIRNFRIHERADGVKVFNKGDIVTDGEMEDEVLEVFGDSCLLGNPYSGVTKVWVTLQWMSLNGWKLKYQEDTVEEDKDKEIHGRHVGTFNTLLLQPGLIAKEVNGRIVVEREEPHDSAVSYQLGYVQGKADAQLDMELGRSYTKQEIVDVLKEHLDIANEPREDTAYAKGYGYSLKKVAEKLNINLDEYE